MPAKKQSRKPVRVPVIMQMEAMECGAACLNMILAYYGKWVTLETLREECGVSRDGQKLSMVVKAAEHHGLSYEARRFRPESIYQKATFPCMIHWRGVHFVVLCGVKGDKVYINDPALGNVVRSKKEFEENYSGMCVMFSPSDSFVPSGKKPGTLSYIIKRLKDCKPAVAYVAITTIIVAGLGILQPFFLRNFMDKILASDSKGPGTLIFLMLIVAAVQLFVSWFSALKQLRLFGLISVKNDVGFMQHIFHLPERFFFQRDTGDLQQRQQANSTISETMINLLIPLVLNTALMAFYGIFMISYSPLLSAVGILAIIINSICTRHSAKKRLNISRITRNDTGKLYSETAGAITMFETIKACGAENNSFSAWAAQQEKVFSQNLEYDSEMVVMKNMITFINDIATYLILCFGLVLIYNGDFTKGMMMSFHSIFMMFLRPVEQVVASEQLLNEMRVDLERVEDVMKYPEYHPYSDKPVDEDAYKLKGNIELKNVSFGYSPLEPPLVKDFCLSVKPGSCVALVGRSGSGKSTISSLISGLYEPWEGEILYDGKPISEIPEKIFRSSLSVVSQNIVLFKDSVENNLKLWNPYVENFEMMLAVRDAEANDGIMDKPGGYAYQISESGHEFSGGEKQRLEIARALAVQPTILIMDEATSALDAMTEFEIVNNVRKLGITCIIVAHRLSTIRDCDEIIVMNDGNVIERGTHEELLDKHGYYSELISSM
ncbi:MAG: ATP-binding cassette domain-containing protein [Lachnospiraceae bacterium]|nr:ATP-binding cassette domain-containing protein [Lachnospiraceae bacterium]